MQKKYIPLILILIAMIVFLTIQNRQVAKSCSLSACPSGTCTLPIPMGEVESKGMGKIGGNKNTLPMLLEVSSKTCRPCKKMEPILRALQSSYTGQLKVIFVDVLENRAVVEKYGIKSVPTQIFFDSKGTILFRHSGVLSSEEILDRWKKLGYTFLENVK